MHAIDLSNTPNASWERFGPAAIVINSNLANYNMVVRDDARQGFWLCTSGGGDRTLFIDKNGNITNYMVWNAHLGRGGIAYSPSLDLLMVKSGSGNLPGTRASLCVMRANDRLLDGSRLTGVGPGLVE